MMEGSDETHGLLAALDSMEDVRLLSDGGGGTTRPLPTRVVATTNITIIIITLTQRLVGILKDGATLVAAEDDASLERQGREFVKSVLAVRRDLHSLIDKMPRTDYPRQNTTLRDQYLRALPEP